MKDPVNSCNAKAEINWILRVAQDDGPERLYLLPFIMAARSVPLKLVFSLRVATIAVSDFWQAIMRL